MWIVQEVGWEGEDHAHGSHLSYDHVMSCHAMPCDIQVKLTSLSMRIPPSPPPHFLSPSSRSLPPFLSQVLYRNSETCRTVWCPRSRCISIITVYTR